jgi:acyl dehydratase
MKKYWDQVEIGQRIASLSQAPITRLQIAQFSAASDYYSPLHLDEEYARNMGYGSVFAPSILALALAEESLKSFANNIGLISLSGTFQRLIWPGDTLTSKGILIRRYQKNSEYRVQFNIWVENQHNEVVMKGNALCSFFKNEEHQAKSSLNVPEISKEAHEALVNKCNSLPRLRTIDNAAHQSQKELA